jgi:fructose-bisphosphate aldolase, class II
MKTLKEYIQEAKERGIAVGHFNVSNLEGVYAIADAAQALNVPVIVGVSEGERDFTGVKEIAAVVKTLREERNQPIFLNADHTYSIDRVKEAVEAGFDAAIFDGAQLGMEENIAKAKGCVDFAKEYKKLTNRDVIIEGELGYIGTSSKVLTEVPEGAAITEENLTKVEDAVRFVQETGVDMLAPAVGNIHGMFAKGKDPALSIETVRKISEATGVPLVLHGASGNSDADVQAAIKAGVAVVHVNTELRVAYREGLEGALDAKPDEVAPYKYEKVAKEAMQKVVEEKLRIFNFL